MVIRVPDTLKIENAESYIVSIRLYPDGFSFTGYIPSDLKSFFYTEFNLDHTISYLNALKDCFFKYSFFSNEYREIYITVANNQYTLVPESVFWDKKVSKLMSFVFLSSEYKILHSLQKDLEIEVAFAINPEIYDFFNYKLAAPRFTHVISPMLSLCRKLNLSCYPKQLFVAVHENLIDAICFDKGALIFANSFNYGANLDIIYYILYVWKQTGLDQINDELHLYSDTHIFSEIKGTLQHYLYKINQLKINNLFDDTNIPMDVKALFECGL